MLQVATPTTVVQPLPLVLPRLPGLLTREDGGPPLPLPLDAQQQTIPTTSKTMTATTSSNPPRPLSLPGVVAESANASEAGNMPAANPNVRAKNLILFPS